MKNVIENLTTPIEVIESFKGIKAKGIAGLLFKESEHAEDYLNNFAGKGFNFIDDLLIYRSYRIEKEDKSFVEFEIESVTFGICTAVSSCFYQVFEEQEAIITNRLFEESQLTYLSVFEQIKNQNNLSLYKLVL